MGFNEQILEHDERRRIYEYVRARPGLHMRRLERDLTIALGTLEYHLYRLERAGMLAVRRLGRFKTYFVEGRLDGRDKDCFYFLRQEMPRRIALEIVNEPGLSFVQLCRRLPIAPSTVSYHLQKLVKVGMLRELRVGREKAYECAEASRVRRLILEYRKTFTDAVVDRFVSAWMDLSPYSVPPLEDASVPVGAPTPALTPVEVAG